MTARVGKKDKKGGRQQWLLLAAGAAVASSLLATACCCSRESAASPAETSSTLTVPVVLPTQQNLVRTIRQPGWIKSYEETPIYAKISGFVESVNVDIGDHVKKGELLAKLWEPEMVQELKLKDARVVQAKADLVQAREQLNAANANIDTVAAQVKEAEAGITRVEAEVKRWDGEYYRAKDLYGKKVYDKATMDESQHQMEASRAGLDQVKAKYLSMKAAYIESVAKRDKAKADVDAAKAKVDVCEADDREYAAWLDYQNIRAPYDGVITERIIHTGHFVTPSSSDGSMGSSKPDGNTKTSRPLFNMVRMDIMRITIQVPECDAVLVKNGTPATVTFQGLLDKEVSAKVTRFSWSLDDHARTLCVEIHLRNPEEELRPGMYAYASIMAELPGARVVPAEAVVDDGDRLYCCVVENGKVVRTVVKTGYRTDTLVQLLKKQVRPGDAAGRARWLDFTGKEAIVARNPKALIDGQSVATEPDNRPTFAQADSR
jgi:HlyD family secretion protein